MSGARWLVLAAAAVLSAGGADALARTDLYPYGVQQQDQRLPVGDDISSSEVQLTVPISFYERLYTSLYVSTTCHQVSCGIFGVDSP